jgi:catenin alpha
MLVQVANLACSVSNNEEGIKMVRMATAQIETLCPQVVNAARVLTARPRSKVALENMDVFKDAWERQVRLLMDAVDDITTIEDFLAVSGLELDFFYVVSNSHIEFYGVLKDLVNSCKLIAQ